MVEFLAGEELTGAIHNILAEAQGCFAVAFWGSGATEKLHKKGKGDFRAICNLALGGTNPSEIRKLKRQNIRQSDTLHAKVYIGRKSVIVSSANISANGLGFEGMEQARWIEAGTISSDKVAASGWFDELWEKSRDISEGDLKKAELAWKRRQQARPTLNSIADFNALSPYTPLLSWFGTIEYKADQDALETYGIAEEQLDDSLLLEGDGRQDRAALAPGKWVIVWDATDEGVPYNRKPRWFYTGRRIPKVFKDEKDEFRDAIIQSDNIPSVPFYFDKPTKKLFYDVLLRPEYDALRAHDVKGAWFTKSRIKLMRRFWLEFAQQYKDHQKP